MNRNCLKSLCLLLALVVCQQALRAEESREAVVKRVSDDIRYLASEQLEGRGVETKGIHLAAEHIIRTFQEYGLKPGMPDGSYKQPFQITLGKSRIKDETGVTLVGPDGDRWELKESEFQPLQRGANGKASGDLVFIGYGISSDDDHYDDYAGVDVSGKIVVMIRREPGQGIEDGPFDGKTLTPHAYIDTKLQLAKEHNAAGIIFVNDPFSVSSPEQDELTDPAGFGARESGIPFVHVRQSVIDRLLSQSPVVVKNGDKQTQLTSLKQVTDYIDSTMKPVSQSLTGWKADVKTLFDTRTVEAYNIIGILEAEGPLADETIVLGGHYDHLGYGGYGSRAKDRTGQIHYGADDNATGTAAVLEMVRRLTTGAPLKRRIVFICFSGEERGLLGSKHYVSNPVIPLEKTVAMLNYDMIGTLRNNRIDVNGVGTATQFQKIVEAADEASPLDIKIIQHPMAGSDHLPFYQHQIPVMFCFTGITPRYHTPDDKFEVINVPGTVQVIDYTESLLRGIDALPSRPDFVNPARRRRPERLPFLGILPNLAADADEDGVPLQMVRPNTPAATAGLTSADVVIGMNDQKIANYADILKFLKTAKSGQQVAVKVRRNKEEKTLQVTLGEPR